MTELLRALAPWDLEGIGFTFLIRTPFSLTPIPLPEGAYHPMEKGTSAADLSTRFHGGCGCVMLVRYESSPAGPYDELLYVPGLFSKVDGSSTHYYYSITRIWVSTEASVLNGRSNWGIPKHLAKFSFTPSTSSPKSPLLVTVSPVSSISTPTITKPFFKALLSTSKWLPSIQVRTVWFANAVAIEFFGIPNQTLLQPKLPSAVDSDSTEFQKESIKNENRESLVGSAMNYLVNLRACGSAKICYLKKVGEDNEEGSSKWEGFGDGESFPRFEVFGGRGCRIKFDMKFWEPEPAGLEI